MNLVIDLPLPVEAHIEREAQRTGKSPAELVAEVLKKTFSATIDPEEQRRLNAPSIALLEVWLKRAEVPATPEQIAQAEAEQREFMRNMNLSRKEAGERLHYPDVEKS